MFYNIFNLFKTVLNNYNTVQQDTYAIKNQKKKFVLISRHVLKPKKFETGWTGSGK